MRTVALATIAIVGVLALSACSSGSNSSALQKKALGDLLPTTSQMVKTVPALSRLKPITRISPTLSGKPLKFSNSGVSKCQVAQNAFASLTPIQAASTEFETKTTYYGWQLKRAKSEADAAKFLAAAKQMTVDCAPGGNIVGGFDTGFPNAVGVIFRSPSYEVVAIRGSIEVTDFGTTSAMAKAQAALQLKILDAVH